MTDRENAKREMSFEEEAQHYEKEARAVFAKESGEGEVCEANNILRRGMRVIRKAREELAHGVTVQKHGRWIMTLYTTTSEKGRVILNKKAQCSKCGYGNGRKQTNYCPCCGVKMEE